MAKGEKFEGQKEAPKGIAKPKEYKYIPPEVRKAVDEKYTQEKNLVLATSRREEKDLKTRVEKDHPEIKIA